MRYWIQESPPSAEQWTRNPALGRYETALDALEARDRRLRTWIFGKGATRYRVVSDDGRVVEYQAETVPRRSA